MGKGIFYYNKSEGGIMIEGPFKEGKPETINGVNFKIRYSNGEVYEGHTNSNM